MSISTRTLLEDFSVEMTAKDVAALGDARALLPAGTRVNVTFLGSEDLSMRRTAARAVSDSGLIPVAHVAARRLESRRDLEEFLSALAADGTSRNLFVIAGDPAQPQGPYEDALALIEDVAFDAFGIDSVSIAGYPEGHPEIAESVLWSALERKSAFLTAHDEHGDIVTQFGFDVEPVLAWIENVRARGITAPIRVGVPGPAGVKRLLAYARRFGVGSSAEIVKKYGLSLANLLGTAGPDRFLLELAARLDPDAHGTIRVHFYTFGGLRATADWIAAFSERTATRSVA